MKIAIEMFTLVIAVTISCILFSSIISSDNQNADARNFYNVVVNRIEDSNCNLQIIEACIKEAESNGYELSVEDVTVYAEHPSRLVTMKYSIRFPVFGLFGNDYEKQAVIEGYAR
ncbi:MAG: hypothetical protein ACLRZ9_02890 [Eubacterium sp.]